MYKNHAEQKKMIEAIQQFYQYVYTAECKKGNEQAFLQTAEEVEPKHDSGGWFVYPFFYGLTRIVERLQNATVLTQEEEQTLCMDFLDIVSFNIQTPEVKKYINRIYDVVQSFNPQGKYIGKLSLYIVSKNLIQEMSGREFDVIDEARTYIAYLKELVGDWEQNKKQCENSYNILKAKCSQIPFMAKRIHTHHCQWSDRMRVLQAQIDYYDAERTSLHNEFTSMGLCSFLLDNEDFLQTITHVCEQNIENFSNTYKPNPRF